MTGWRKAALGAVTAALIAVATGGCGSNTFALSREAVETHRARWEAEGPTDYAYDYRRLCECLPDSVREARIEVRGGAVRAATFTDSGETVSSIRAYPTVDELFDLIEDAMQRGAATLNVSYDARLGYPTRIDIDYDLESADDEIAIQTADLSAL